MPGKLRHASGQGVSVECGKQLNLYWVSTGGSLYSSILFGLGNLSKLVPKAISFGNTRFSETKHSFEKHQAPFAMTGTSMETET